MFSYSSDEGNKPKVPAETLIERYKQGKMTALALINLLGEALKVHVEIKETVTSGKAFYISTSLPS